MIKQLSSTCYEWKGGGFDVRFIGDEPIAESRQHCPRLPVVAAPQRSEKRLPREDLLPHRNIIEPIMGKYGRFDLCGSYRRGKDTVKDMDYVIECPQDSFLVLRSELAKAGVEFHRGATEIMNGTLNGVACDFFRADPESYTSILIWRTGSARHNIICAVIARKRGMRILRKGIVCRDGILRHPMAEPEFYKILGMRYLAPNEREMEPW